MLSQRFHHSNLVLVTNLSSLLIDEFVYIHPDSVMTRDPLPDLIVFQEIVESGKKKRSYMRGALIAIYNFAYSNDSPVVF